MLENGGAQQQTGTIYMWSKSQFWPLVWVCADNPSLCVCVQMLDSHGWLLHVWIPFKRLQITIKIHVLFFWPLLRATNPSILTYISILSPKFCKLTTVVKENWTHQCFESKNTELIPPISIKSASETSKSHVCASAPNACHLLRSSSHHVTPN